VIEVDLSPLNRRQIGKITIIGIMRKVGYAVGTHPFQDDIHKGGFSAARTTRHCNDKGGDA
jgi:hypothetical protein